MSACLVTIFFCDFILTFDLSDPKITVNISVDSITPMVGMMLTLTCNVGGDDRITNPTTTYLWSRNGMVVPNQTQQTWSLSPLAYSHAGQYSCVVDISSPILPSSPISTLSDPFNVTLSCKSWHNVLYSRNIGEDLGITKFRR